MEKKSEECVVCGQNLSGVDWLYGQEPIWVQKYFGTKATLRQVCWHCVNKLVWQNAKENSLDKN